MLEIEIKAALNDKETAQLEATLVRLGFIQAFSCHEEDIYYNGNDRDFQETDEALRIRTHTENGIAAIAVTYKGAKQDGLSQTRTELETGVADAAVMQAILERLGYRRVLEVKKDRRSFSRGEVNLCLDEVERIGRYLELETVAPDGMSVQDKEKLLEKLFSLLDLLGVSRENLTRKSYLELLLGKASSARTTSKKSDQGV